MIRTVSERGESLLSETVLIMVILRIFNYLHTFEKVEKLCILTTGSIERNLSSESTESPFENYFTDFT